MDYAGTCLMIESSLSTVQCQNLPSCLDLVPVTPLTDIPPHPLCIIMGSELVKANS